MAARASALSGVARPITGSDREAPYRAFRDQLFEKGLLFPTGTDGIYLRSHVFEQVVAGIERLVAGAAGDEEMALRLHFPAVVPRRLLVQSDYVRSFPDLVGVVHTFTEGEPGLPALLDRLEGGEEWTTGFEPTDLALCSAACHPLYPGLSGVLSDGERRFELTGQVFRHEASVDPARMQTFRQHEVVYVGEPDGALRHRNVWAERARTLLELLGLEVEVVVANDPFFGRAGKMLAANQREEALKLEILSPICSSEAPTAIASANCHLDHFGVGFGISLPDGRPAHSACVGFGLERITLALLARHGYEPEQWPTPVKAHLGW